MSTRMTREEAETFLSEVRVGVLSIAEPGRGPLTVPVWYSYEAGGEVSIITEPGSRKGKLISLGQRVSLVVQNEAPPYQYVSVEGPIRSIDTAELEKHQRPMAQRYLGVEGGNAYVAFNQPTDAASGDDEAPQIIVSVTPERWLSADYSKESIGL